MNRKEVLEKLLGNRAQGAPDEFRTEAGKWEWRVGEGWGRFRKRLPGSEAGGGLSSGSPSTLHPLQSRLPSEPSPLHPAPVSPPPTPGYAHPGRSASSSRSLPLVPVDRQSELPGQGWMSTLGLQLSSLSLQKLPESGARRTLGDG